MNVLYVPPKTMEPITGLISALIGLIGLVAAAIGLNARKDAQLNAAKIEAVRLEIKADLATLELRLTTEFHNNSARDPERLARIEEQLKAMQQQLALHEASVQLQLTTLAKIRQGCEDCILKDRRSAG